MKPQRMSGEATLEEETIEVEFDVIRTHDGDGYNEPRTFEDEITVTGLTLWGVRLNPKMSADASQEAVRDLLRAAQEHHEVVKQAEMAEDDSE